MLFELFLGFRYLRAKRKQAFISVISVISVLGVMVGVMALIVVLSVMNGFRADLMGKILGVNAHVLVMSYGGPYGDHVRVAGRVMEVPGVKAVTPFVYGQVMVNNAGRISGALLRGIDPRTVGEVLNITSMIREGALPSLRERRPGPPSIILGQELAKQIGAHEGDIIKVVAPEGRLTPMGRVPQTKKFLVKALFDSGMYEYDASMVFVGLREAQEFLGLGDRVTGLEVRVRDVDRSNTVAKAIQERLGYPYWTKDWKMMNRNLFSALKLEKVTMFVILTMIVLVGALDIISTLVMVVMEKTKDIAILRAIGASSRSVMAVFMLQGLMV
ncbi:MAG: lipoprotein-releasing system transmembrane subunit LolC, partial [Deltaproteobacteria bacterium]